VQEFVRQGVVIRVLRLQVWMRGESDFVTPALGGRQCLTEDRMVGSERQTLRREDGNSRNRVLRAVVCKE
jgi:hypothetical protein